MSNGKKTLKIGMVDYDLNEWHAENYPDFFKRFSDGKIEIAYVYAIVDGKDCSARQWADKYNVTLCNSISQLTELSDGIIVLSPDNPEFHPVLSEIPLASGKRVFIDKTFSKDYSAAIAMLERAKKYGTTCYSASALCFADEYKPVIGQAKRLECTGVGEYENYSIHQIDPILTIIGEKADSVYTDMASQAVVIEFESGKTASFRMREHSYKMKLTDDDGKESEIIIEKDFWENCIRAMTRFFCEGETPVPNAQTLQAMAIREAGLLSLKDNGRKVYLKEITEKAIRS